MPALGGVLVVVECYAEYGDEAKSCITSCNLG